MSSFWLRRKTCCRNLPCVAIAYSYLTSLTNRCFDMALIESYSSLSLARFEMLWYRHFCYYRLKIDFVDDAKLHFPLHDILTLLLHLHLKTLTLFHLHVLEFLFCSPTNQASC